MNNSEWFGFIPLYADYMARGFSDQDIDKAIEMRNIARLGRGVLIGSDNPVSMGTIKIKRNDDVYELLCWSNFANVDALLVSVNRDFQICHIKVRGTFEPATAVSNIERPFSAGSSE